MTQPQLSVLRSLILQALHNLEGVELPQGRAVRAREALTAAVALADDLMTVKPAAVIGAKGGKTTAKRLKKDPDYYKRIAGMRKRRAGGRPKKTAG